MMKKSGMDNDVNQALVDLLESHNNLEWDDQDDMGELYSSDEEGGLSTALSTVFGDDMRRVPSRRASAISSKRTSVSDGLDLTTDETKSNGSEASAADLPRMPAGTRVGGQHLRRRSVELRAARSGIPADGSLGGVAVAHSSGLYSVRAAVDEDASSLVVGKSSVSFSHGALSTPQYENERRVSASAQDMRRVSGASGGLGSLRRGRRPSMLDTGLQPGQTQHDPGATSGDSDDGGGLGSTLLDSHSGPMSRIKSNSPESSFPTSHSTQSGPLPILSAKSAPSSNLFQSLRYGSAAAVSPISPSGATGSPRLGTCPFQQSEDTTPSEAGAPSVSTIPKLPSVPALRPSFSTMPLFPAALSRLLLNPLPTPR